MRVIRIRELVTLALIGAVGGWLAVYLGGGLWLGVLVAALTGVVFGVLHAHGLRLKERVGATLEIVSVHDGKSKGCRVRFTLPIDPPPKRPERRKSARPEIGPAGASGA